MADRQAGLRDYTNTASTPYYIHCSKLLPPLVQMSVCTLPPLPKHSKHASPFPLFTTTHLFVLGSLEVGLQIVFASAHHLADFTAVVHRARGSRCGRGGHAQLLLVDLTHQVGLEILYSKTDRQIGIQNYTFVMQICAIVNV